MRGVTTAPTVTYTWDSDPTYGTSADGMIVRVNVGSDYQERYTFDSLKRVSSTIRTIGSKTYTSSYGYNQASQSLQLTYPSGRVINIGHDSAGRFSSMADAPGNGSNTYLRGVSYELAKVPVALGRARLDTVLGPRQCYVLRAAIADDFLTDWDLLDGTITVWTGVDDYVNWKVVVETSERTPRRQTVKITATDVTKDFGSDFADSLFEFTPPFGAKKRG